MAAGAGEKSSAAHVALLTWQLARVAEALALARATRRALVLPRLLCSCDAVAVKSCMCVCLLACLFGLLGCMR